MAKNALKTATLGTVLAVAAVGATASSASAYIACNRWHDCWHVATKPAYPARLGVTWYEDSWRTAHPTGYHWWGDRDEHGYYWHGRWRRF